MIKRSAYIVLIGLLSATLSRSGQAVSPSFKADCEALTKNAHRLVGTPESAEAASYIETRLKEIGPDDIFIQPFSTNQTRVKRCEMSVDGTDVVLKLEPIRPNGIVPPVSPIEGISGKLIYARKGTASDFAEISPYNAVVVLDYNCSDGWLRAFRLGAKAVVFVGNGVSEAWHTHYLENEANVPRYYRRGALEELPLGKDVTVHCEVVWESVTANNIIAFFRGVDPVFRMAKEEVVVLSAPIDSFGEVPTLSPGARSAANCAALLKIAEYVKNNRPRRHVLVAFFDGEARGLIGSGAFYRIFEPNLDTVKLPARAKYLEDEEKFIAGLKNLLQEDLPIYEKRSKDGEVMPGRKDIIRRLQAKAAEGKEKVADLMYDLRNERLQISKTDPDSGAARMQEIKRRIEEDLQPERDTWNALQRVLGHAGRGRVDDITPEVGRNLGTLIDEVKADVELRASELRVDGMLLEKDAQIAAALKPREPKDPGPAGPEFVLHVSLFLGDTTPYWGLAIGGDSLMHSYLDTPAEYGKIQSAFLRTYKNISGLIDRKIHFVTETADQTLPRPKIMVAPAYVHSGETAGLFGIYNLAVATSQEALTREGTPDDTLDRLNLDLIEQQADEFALLFCVGVQGVADNQDGADNAPDEEKKITIADHDNLSFQKSLRAITKYVPAYFEGETPKGPMVMGMPAGSAVPNTPIPGALIHLRFRLLDTVTLNNARKIYGFDNSFVLRSNANGVYGYGPATDDWVYVYIWVNGIAAVFDERGLITNVSRLTIGADTETRFDIFPCRSGFVTLPPQMRVAKKKATDRITVLTTRGNASLIDRRSFVDIGDGVLGWYAPMREKALKFFGLEYMVALNNGPEGLSGTIEDVDVFGSGFPTTETQPPMHIAARSSSDLLRLNQSWLDVLFEKNVLDSSLAELSGRSEDLLIESSKEKSPIRSESLSTSSYWSSVPVYAKVRGLFDDLVYAILILLGLCVPFSFAAERLVFGSVTVYKQITTFALIFFATFIILYFSHPAFAIAGTPIIIFLGFAIVVMSVMVIAVIMKKFEGELKEIQGLKITVHSADVSRVSTFVAAMQMGISTMRRRPLRTALTAVTIILLTFTILCFASFSMQSGVIRLAVTTNPAYSGVWFHSVNWRPLTIDTLDVVDARWGMKESSTKPGEGALQSGDVSVHPRFWITPANRDAAGFMISRGDGTRPMEMRGLLGIDPGEIDHRPDLKEILGAEMKDSVLITKSVARVLEVNEGDTVIVKGAPLKVAKLLTSADVSAARDMDNSGILPVDFAEMVQQMGQEEMDKMDEAATSTRNWSSLVSDQVVIVSVETARKIGAVLYGITMYTEDTESATAIAEELARMLPYPVSATRVNGVYRHMLGVVLAASGVKNLFFPVLLGGLVIFGTMLGSVSDREKEIYTFSALGLAPRHVATLFFAESIVYSLIGGMGGYILAQGSMKILTLLSERGLTRLPEMNVSSTNTIFTILIVMATVLVSAIYPAIKASKSANPGLLRSWKPSEPKGNVMDLIFPFTVSEYDITGVVSFLKEHFDAYSDVGIGRFMSEGAVIIKDEKGMLGLDAGLLLAPFDLGVGQSFQLRSKPSEIPGIDEVGIRLERKSGQPGDWKRLNKVFLDDLRRQFLIWRSIPQDTMETYRQKTLTAINNPPEKDDRRQ